MLESGFGGELVEQLVAVVWVSDRDAAADVSAGHVNWRRKVVETVEAEVIDKEEFEKHFKSLNIPKRRSKLPSRIEPPRKFKKKEEEEEERDKKEVMKEEEDDEDEDDDEMDETKLEEEDDEREDVEDDRCYEKKM
ncbi:glutamic acid-rich protein-like [Chenopodium quinoa]|uniref:glutamic acid-rich protein-like n=1 Tax=Chenopodium quinoa TaxID=63459 RepID=UPI000B79352C|nr:glutamic acid-rich protein-like [Chenopodium quinoa]